MILDDDVVAQTRIGNPGSGSNLAVFADRCFSFDCYVWIDDAVAAELCFGADVGMRRIQKSYASFDHEFANRATTHQVFKFRQLGPGVDSGDLPSVAVNININALAIGQKYLRYIR